MPRPLLVRVRSAHELDAAVDCAIGLRSVAELGLAAADRFQRFRIDPVRADQVLRYRIGATLGEPLVEVAAAASVGVTLDEDPAWNEFATAGGPAPSPRPSSCARDSGVSSAEPVWNFTSIPMERGVEGRTARH